MVLVLFTFADVFKTQGYLLVGLFTLTQCTKHSSPSNGNDQQRKWQQSEKVNHPLRSSKVHTRDREILVVVINRNCTV